MQNNVHICFSKLFVRMFIDVRFCQVKPFLREFVIASFKTKVLFNQVKYYGHFLEMDKMKNK